MVHEIIKRVRETLAQPGMSKHKLAIVAGLHRNTLRDVDDPDWNPSAATLAALEPHIVGSEVEASPEAA
ncbi:MAG: hypothetical protein J7498_05405 [Sphingobium sp.]|nr:hypothetical protein [Sphingobium sp.]